MLACILHPAIGALTRFSAGRAVLLTDVPTGLEDVRCPVSLAQGTADVISSGQTLRLVRQATRRADALRTG